MKATLLIICALGCSISASTQNKNFDLSKYKFPDYKRHELELNFNSNGNSYRNSHNSQDVNFIRNYYLTSTSISNLSLGYLYENFTRRRVDYLYSSLTGNYQYSKNKNQGIINKIYNPDINFNLYGYRRYYLKENKHFLESSSYLYNNFSESKTTNSKSEDFRLRRNNYLKLNVGFGFGVGRMEKVSDLWQAYYILEKLKAQKSIVKELTSENIYSFADQISKLKNKRFFDARLRKIAELQSLDSLLHKNGLLESSDIKYFTTLNDYWSYGNFQSRESGKEIKLMLTPNYSRTISKQDDFVADISNETNLNSSLTFNCNKQLNLFWERFFHIGIFNELLLGSTGSNSSNFPKNLFQTGTRIGYGFYPDTRTSLKLSAGYSVFESRTYDPDELKNWSNSFSLNFVGNYFISQRLQVTGTFDIYYNKFPQKSNSSTHTKYNLVLRYAIF